MLGVRRRGAVALQPAGGWPRPRVPQACGGPRLASPCCGAGPAPDSEIPEFLLKRLGSCCGSPAACRLRSAGVLKRQFLAPASHSRAPRGGQPSRGRRFAYTESPASGVCCCFSRKNSVYKHCRVIRLFMKSGKCNRARCLSLPPHTGTVLCRYGAPSGSA